MNPIGFIKYVNPSMHMSTPGIPGIAIPVAPKEFSLSCAVDVNESPSEEALVVWQGPVKPSFDCGM